MMYNVEVMVHGCLGMDGGTDTRARYCFLARADQEQWLVVSDTRPWDKLESVVIAAIAFKKKARDLDLDLPEGCKAGVCFVTAAELAFLISFANFFIMGKPVDYGTSSDGLQRECARNLSLILKYKLEDVVKDSRILPFRVI